VTHLLINHHAYAIGSALAIAEISQEGIVTDPNRAAFTLFSRAGDIWLDPGKEQNLTLNRQPVSQSVRVTPGDQLTVAGIDCQLISAG
ncbi:MAG: hypothetical protein KDI36_09465, partial [Pseudomonadales bacterium]|nr:hypothetical protein [Pseudomonadales bacterium]